MAGEISQLAPLTGGDGLAGGVRMPADRGSQARKALSQFDAPPVVGGIVTDVDHGFHPSRSRIVEGLLRGQRVAQVQEVGVRIDQATGSGFSMRGNRTPPSEVCVRGASLPHSRAVSHGVFRSTLTWAATLPAVSGRKGETK